MKFDFEVSYDDLCNCAEELWTDKKLRQSLLKIYYKKNLKLKIFLSAIFSFIIALFFISYNFILTTCVTFSIIFLFYLLFIILDLLLNVNAKRFATYINHYIDKVKPLYKKNKPIKYNFEASEYEPLNEKESSTLLPKRIIIGDKNTDYILFIDSRYNSILSACETNNYYTFLINAIGTIITFIIPKRCIPAEFLCKFQNLIKDYENLYLKNKKVHIATICNKNKNNRELGIEIYNVPIISVREGSVAEKIGLQSEDIILQINDKNMLNISNVRCANEIKKSKHLKIVVKNANTGEIRIIETDL